MRRSTGRERLANVLRDTGDLVTIDDAAQSLGVSRQEAAKTLWRWSQQGWFRHVRRVLYAPIPPDSPLQAQVLPEPWILVPELFDPAYVGGWSAAEHWDLAEQIFLSVLVCTASGSKPREQRIQGTTFVLKRVKPDKIFGTRPVWYGKVKVQVSDVHRTVVDMLDEPRIGGGIRHVFDLPKLVEYADRLGNGAVFKRLGFLLSRLGVDEDMLDACQSRLTAATPSWIPPHRAGGSSSDGSYGYQGLGRNRDMIDRGEVLTIASERDLRVDMIEKDYVLGWMLAGIFAHPVLGPA